MTDTTATDSPRDLIVSEVFGPTVQGEGPNTGRRCAFIRLGLCNLDCVWCDTPYTWDWSRFDRATELHRETVDAVVNEVRAMNVHRVVITGGEPLVQRRALLDLVVALHTLPAMVVEIETNGTIDPGVDLLGSVDWWNVSPKLAHSGVAANRAIHTKVLEALSDTDHAAFKFVCQTAADVGEVAGVVQRAGLVPETVWIMPEGRDPTTLQWRLADIAEAAIQRRYNLTGRLHVEVWGDKRGH